jgi:hypothetical protein
MPCTESYAVTDNEKPFSGTAAHDIVFLPLHQQVNSFVISSKQIVSCRFWIFFDKQT